MNNETIEAFIRQHRQSLDQERPGAHGWTSVQKALEYYEQADALEREVLLQRLLLDSEAPSENVWAGIEAALNRQADHDPLEVFVFAHRDELDTELPSGRIWESIYQELPEKKPARLRSLRPLLRVAAAAALLLTGLTVGIWYGTTQNEPAKMSMSQISPEFAELEEYYKYDIAGKKAQLVAVSGSQPVDVLADLDQLDLMMEDLKRELANVPEANREQVVRAMIETYQAKTAILKRVLEYLESVKPDSTQRTPNHERNSI